MPLSSVRKKVFVGGQVTVLFFVLTALAPLAKAQNSVLLGGGSTPKTRPTKTPDKTKLRKNPSQKPTVVKISKAQPVTSISQRLSVTFITGAKEVEVFLDGKSIGSSDNNGKLKYYIAEGEHQVTASKADADWTIEPLKITVNQTQTKFDISSQVATAVGKPSDNIIVSPPPPQNPVVGKVVPTIGINDIIAVYTNPKKSESITLEDWQNVYEECRRQTGIGSTDNSIEGLQDFAHGQVELTNKNFAKALNLFESARIFLPQAAYVHYGLGNAQIMTGLPTDAIASFQKAVQFDSRFALPHVKIGEIYLAQGKNKEAIQQFQYAIELGADSPELQIRIARAQIKNKNCASALKTFEALKEASSSPELLIDMSGCYVESDRTVTAIEKLKEAIKLDPNSSAAHYKLGVIYFQEKEYGKAKEALERALILDPEGKTINRKDVEKMIKKATERSR